MPWRCQNAFVPLALRALGPIPRRSRVPTPLCMVPSRQVQASLDLTVHTMEDRKLVQYTSAHPIVIDAVRNLRPGFADPSKTVSMFLERLRTPFQMCNHVSPDV